jgi:hypothetical protein
MATVESQGDVCVVQLPDGSRMGLRVQTSLRSDGTTAVLVLMVDLVTGAAAVELPAAVRARLPQARSLRRRIWILSHRASSR